MALILEIRDQHSAVTWRRLDDLPIILGRALSNNVILDDPYVDARHVSISADESGKLTLSDLGSVNGVVANGSRLAGPVEAVAGTEVRLGRTTLRFHDVDEAVPAAVAEARQRLPRAGGWVLTRPGSLGLFVAAITLSAVFAGLSSTERSVGTAVSGGALAAAGFLPLWAVIWALATRGIDRRFRFREHLGMICAAFLFVFVQSVADQWIEFLVPGSWIVRWLSSAVVLAVMGLTVAGHLAVAGALSARGRLIVAGSVAGGLLALVLIGNNMDKDKFNDVATYSAVLKPVGAGVAPAITPEEFMSELVDIRSKADKALH